MMTEPKAIRELRGLGPKSQEMLALEEFERTG
jgi:hypothetical protein